MVSVPSSSGHVFQRLPRPTQLPSRSVSVPSSSGHVFQPLADGNLDGVFLVVSVPSSSGHVFQPRETLASEPLIDMFQSPLHRGTCSSVDSSCILPSEKSVSVPSSSGHVFQQSEASAFSRHDGRCFSPLFIGARVPATGRLGLTT